MTRYLRKIEKRNWYEPNPNEDNWLDELEIFADPLCDLNTRGNKLSIWIVEDDLSNLNRIALAFSATRDFPAQFDYIIFTDQLINELSLEIDEESPGNTPDQYANTFHRDIIKLSAQKVLAITEQLTHDGIKKRIPEREIKTLLINALDKGLISEAQLRDNMLIRLDRA